MLRKGAEQRQQQQTKQQTKRQKTQQTQVTEAFSYTPCIPAGGRVEGSLSRSFSFAIIGANTDAHSLAKSSAPDEESKGAAELMCTHCRELFSPHSWELHMELGCPQDPAEQVMSEVESTGEQRN